MQLYGVSDISLGSWGLGNPAVSGFMDMCVYSQSNSPAGSYAITVSGASGYVLTNGQQQIPYSLYWDASGAGSLGSQSIQLTNGVKLANLGNANTSTPLCLTGATARLTVKISVADLTAALAGTYTGTVTLLLSPN
jgi:spore coat protein U-like protein